VPGNLSITLLSVCLSVLDFGVACHQSSINPGLAEMKQGHEMKRKEREEKDL
jgi:hypothetical protein